MDDTAHDTVTPRTNVNAEDETQKVLYVHFKETNWWARNPHAWKWACATYWLILTALAASTKNGGVSPETAVGATLGFIPFLAFLAVIKHFVHDRALKKYKEEWSLPKDSWSANIGGILKIYD